MRIVKTVAELRSIISEQRRAGKRIGLVPTMGALHPGHMSLVPVVREHSDFVVLWIFVNPTQFNSKQDLDSYPRELESDCRKAGQAGVDLVFAPEADEIYPEGLDSGYQRCSVAAGGYSRGLCGATRPGHFDGVVSVVTIFFNIVQPDAAVFGEKDYQQLKVIQQLVHDLHMPIKIVAAPLVRETDGLALSSRNQLLSSEDRERGLSISHSLFEAKRLVAAGEPDAAVIRSMVSEQLEAAGLKVDYVEIVDTETLVPLRSIESTGQLVVAAFAGAVRLIDNIRLEK